MSRRDLRPLPSQALKRIQLVKARHEKEIRELMLAWHAERADSGDNSQPLTCDQQSRLRSLIVGMGVHLGEAEGHEYLAVALTPEQFEIDIHKLMDVVAAETQDRCETLAAEFDLEEGCWNGCTDHKTVVYACVRQRLKSVIDRLVIDAWSADEHRLQAECANATPGNGTAAMKLAPSAGIPDDDTRRDKIAKRLEEIRTDKGMSIGRLTTESGVDRKTVLGILRCRRDATPMTLNRLAKALGVSPKDLID
jgi:DNA-binding Xre family transcriptional regulator